MFSTLYIYVWYFIIYSFLGWCVEVCFCSVETGKFVNRGFLSGPVCPIYGFGMLAVIVCLEPFANNIVALYIGAVLLTSLIELVTGFALKKLFHTTWWDYSTVKFNLGGYICLTFSLLWGVGGVAAIKLIHPVVQWAVSEMPRFIGNLLILMIIVALVSDLIVTINSIFKLNKDLGKLAEMANLLHKGSEVLAENLGNTALEVSEKVDEAKEELTEKTVDISARLDILKATLCDNADFMRRRIVKAFPKMRSGINPDMLDELKKWYQEHK